MASRNVFLIGPIPIGGRGLCWVGRCAWSISVHYANRRRNNCIPSNPGTITELIICSLLLFISFSYPPPLFLFKLNSIFISSMRPLHRQKDTHAHVISADYYVLLWPGIEKKTHPFLVLWPFQDPSWYQVLLEGEYKHCDYFRCCASPCRRRAC